MDSFDVVTVTLNPALDQTVTVESLTPGEVHRAERVQVDAGGKGVNVASFLADYGLTTAVTGFLGMENPNLFERLLADKGIADQFVRVPGPTRTNVKLVAQVTQQTTDINMRGSAPPDTAVQDLLTRIEELAPQTAWFALCGNLPPGLRADIYTTLIGQIRAQGKQVALDTSGEALRHGLTAGPTFVKPNLLELSQVVGVPLDATPTAVEPVARQLLAHGIELVVVSLAEAGALFVTAEQSFTAVPPPVTVHSSVGAGDALVAGLLAGFQRGLALEDCARLATGFAVGAIGCVGPHLPNTAVVERYAEQAKIVFS